MLVQMKSRGRKKEKVTDVEEVKDKERQNEEKKESRTGGRESQNKYS